MNKHWAERCKERGITEDPEKLWWKVKRGIQLRELDLVLTFKTDRYWRFHCASGIFYAITRINGSDPITVFTQKMIRSKKFAAKKHRKGLHR